MPTIQIGNEVIEYPEGMDHKTVVHAASTYARKKLIADPGEIEKLAPADRDAFYNIAAVGIKPDLHGLDAKGVVENMTPKAREHPWVEMNRAIQLGALPVEGQTFPGAGYVPTKEEAAKQGLGLVGGLVAGSAISRGVGGLVSAGMRPPTPGTPSTTQTTTTWKGGNPWSTNAGQTRPPLPAQLPSGAPAEPSMVGAQGASSNAPPDVSQVVNRTTIPGTPGDPGGILRRAGGAVASGAAKSLPWLLASYLLGRGHGGQGVQP